MDISVTAGESSTLRNHQPMTFNDIFTEHHMCANDDIKRHTNELSIGATDPHQCGLIKLQVFKAVIHTFGYNSP